MLKKVKQMPVPMAILVMVVCILVGVYAGNKNALDKAVAQTGGGLEQIMEMAAQRVDKARNLLVLANRYAQDEPSTEALADAIEALNSAKRPSKIAEANRALTFASEASYALLSDRQIKEVDLRLATGLIDDMGSVDKQLARIVGVYNENIGEARAVYHQLPMRWLLGGVPEVFS